MKLVLKILVLLTLMSTTPPPSERVLKDYKSIELLAEALEQESVYNFARAVGTLEEYELVMEKPYVDVRLETDNYGVVPLEDELLRYIFIFSKYYHMETHLILEMISIENLKPLNVCVAPPNKVAIAEIRHRVQWAYKLRAFGVPEEKIIQQYKNLKEDFFY